MIGERLRGVRQSQGRSLAEVAGKTNISVATLSRIETDKQSIDVALLMELTGVLGVEAAALLGPAQGNGSAPDPLAQRIAGLDARTRTELWRDLAGERRAQRAHGRTATRNIAQEVDELLAQLDFLREELESVRARMKTR